MELKEIYNSGYHHSYKTAQGVKPLINLFKVFY